MNRARRGAGKLLYSLNDAAEIFISQAHHLQSTDVLGALRLATAERHTTLDSSLPLGGEHPTLADYGAHLRMLRAWLAPLEAWLAGFDDGPQAAVAQAGRLALIDADLADTALQGAAVRGAPSAAQAALPADASAAYRWGVCYVIEGSQLGGAVLFQRLAGIFAPHPLRYLQAGGEGPGPRWRLFMQALKAGVQEECEIADACRGACDAFDRILALRP